MMQWLSRQAQQPDVIFYQKALNRQQKLTKPVGSLGVLEDLAVRLAAMQKTDKPAIERIWVTVFAADHGIAEEGVSAFPQIVTTEMVKNFLKGGAAVNVLSRWVKAQFEVVDVGLLNPIHLTGLVINRAGEGTANFAKQAAMTDKQMQQALVAGKAAVERAIEQKSQLFIGGEMGIANTTSASAIAVAITGLSVTQLTGAGTGIAVKAIEHKANIIAHALTFHQQHLDSPFKILQYLGGFEIVALTGSYIFAAQQGLAILIDGFISSVAALLAVTINPSIQPWLFYAHQSQEKGHKLILEYLKVRPLLDLDMRLGEGSGAVSAVPLLQMACKLHNEMATFEQAKITKN